MRTSAWSVAAIAGTTLADQGLPYAYGQGPHQHGWYGHERASSSSVKSSPAGPPYGFSNSTAYAPTATGVYGTVSLPAEPSDASPAPTDLYDGDDSTPVGPLPHYPPQTIVTDYTTVYPTTITKTVELTSSKTLYTSIYEVTSTATKTITYTQVVTPSSSPEGPSSDSPINEQNDSPAKPTSPTADSPALSSPNAYQKHTTEAEATLTYTGIYTTVVPVETVHTSQGKVSTQTIEKTSLVTNFVTETVHPQPGYTAPAATDVQSSQGGKDGSSMPSYSQDGDVSPASTPVNAGYGKGETSAPASGGSTDETIHPGYGGGKGTSATSQASAGAETPAGYGQGEASEGPSNDADSSTMFYGTIPLTYELSAAPSSKGETETTGAPASSTPMYGTIPLTFATPSADSTNIEASQVAPESSTAGGKDSEATSAPAGSPPVYGTIPLTYATPSADTTNIGASPIASDGSETVTTFTSIYTTLLPSTSVRTLNGTNATASTTLTTESTVTTVITSTVTASQDATSTLSPVDGSSSATPPYPYGSGSASAPIYPSSGYSMPAGTGASSLPVGPVGTGSSSITYSASEGVSSASPTSSAVDYPTGNSTVSSGPLGSGSAVLPTTASSSSIFTSDNGDVETTTSAFTSVSATSGGVVYPGGNATTSSGPEGTAVVPGVSASSSSTVVYPVGNATTSSGPEGTAVVPIASSSSTSSILYPGGNATTSSMLEGTAVTPVASSSTLATTSEVYPGGNATASATMGTGSAPVVIPSGSTSAPYTRGNATASASTGAGTAPVVVPSSSTTASFETGNTTTSAFPSGTAPVTVSSSSTSAPFTSANATISATSSAGTAPVTVSSSSTSAPYAGGNSTTSAPIGSGTGIAPVSSTTSAPYAGGNSTTSAPIGSGTGIAPVSSTKTSGRLNTTSSTSSSCTSKPTQTDFCIPCEGQPGNNPDEFCGYTIEDNYYEVTPKTCRTREYFFDVTTTTVAPDGVPRLAQLVNGQMPGPAIEANWGDTVIVHLSNSMPLNGTSIHFHGIRQNYTNEMDGVPSITQCALAPGEKMTYTWRATNYGSSWYHSHFALQAYEGVFGPMIIHGPHSQDFDIDAGFIVLQDWSYATADEMYDAAQTVGPSPQNGPRVLDTGLINGMNTRGSGANLTGSRYEVDFVPGKVHLLRIVNTAIQSTFKFHLDGHKFTVISSDFVSIVPYETDILAINIGQRYNVLVHADQKPGDYWMRSDNQQACAQLTNARDIKGIVHYLGHNGIPTSTAKNYTDSCVDEPYESLVPIVPLIAGAEDKTVKETVLIGPGPSTPNLFKWTLSGTTFQSQWGDPTLYDVYNNGTIPPYSGSLAIEVPRLKEWVYIVVESPIPLPHPIHLHGHDFLILAQGPGLYSDSVPLNLQNPPRRDTAMMPWDPAAGVGGHLVLAFETDNPGAWLMHCHIGWHVSMGFALQIVENLKGIPDTVTDSCQLNDTCFSWNKYAEKNGIEVEDSGV